MNILYITYPLGAIAIFVFVFGLAIGFTRRFQLSWRYFWIGGVVFILSQVLHIPFNAGLTVLFQRGILPTPPPNWHLLFNSAVLGLSAGLFEELARYVMYRWWVKDARTWPKGLLLGAGHGGFEALIIGGLILATFVNIFSLKNVDLATIVPADQLALAQRQITSYWSAAWYDTLLGAVERLFTMPIHICLSIMVLQAFTRRQGWWLWLAVLWHAMIDGLAVYSASKLNTYAVEGIVGLLSLISLGIIFALRQPVPSEAQPSTEALPLPEFKPPVVEETPENLDNTRYNG
jgi:uncharacterized membrane protein YhfC